MRKSIRVVNLGRMPYGACWDLQHDVLEMCVRGELGDTLLLTEHDHVYTIGRSGSDHHLLASDVELRERGVEVFHNDRGGDITYHGPGQLVGYPILNLHNYYLDVHRYLRDLEEVVIRVLRAYGVHGNRLMDYTGVWVGNEKICAIGIKTSRWCTMHGFAFNVNTDLSFFGRIITCGIFDKGVTSLQTILGYCPEMDQIQRHIMREFDAVFEVVHTEGSFEDLPVHSSSVKQFLALHAA